MRQFVALFYFLLCASCALADEPERSPLGLLPQGVTIDLREPTLSEGVLCTDQGGVVTGPDFRLQARHITATCQEVDGENSYAICAEGDLIFEYGDDLFTGERLEYDFSTRTGILQDGRSGIDPWYFGADQIDILPDGNYVLHDAYVTTSPDYCPDWGLYANRAYLTPCHVLYARNLTFRVRQLPLMWFPAFKTNLNSLRDSPLKWRVRFGGKQGPRVGVRYRFWETECFEAAVWLDYRLSRGPGLAIETEYNDCENEILFLTRNYAARDSSLTEPNERFRYRLQGLYSSPLYFDRTTLWMTYDKVSDEDMPSDYSDNDLDLQTSGLTQLRIRTQTDYWIGNLNTRIRVNPFETLKEEIPTVTATVHPFALGPTGIISENFIKAGYFDFKYSNDLPNLKDFNSTRLELRHSLYRPFIFGPVNLTPEAGGVAIYYGNDPEHTPIWMVLGAFGGQMNTHLYRSYDTVKHVMEPYTQYQYLTLPNTDPSKRYVFDIHDGWYTVNALRFGLRNMLYLMDNSCCPERTLYVDLFSYALFNTHHKIARTIPKVFANVVWDMTPRVRHTLGSGWDLEHDNIDHVNYRFEWTASDNFAVVTEYRHRNPWSWRKADPTNYMLDFFHSETELRHSQLSDRRDTILLQTYWRVQHNLILKYQLHRGWNRINEPSYTEYQFDVIHTIRSSWTVRASYQCKPDDHRVAFYINFGLKKPQQPGCSFWNCCDE